MPRLKNNLFALRICAVSVVGEGRHMKISLRQTSDPKICRPRNFPALVVVFAAGCCDYSEAEMKNSSCSFVEQDVEGYVNFLRRLHVLDSGLTSAFPGLR
jgi:hypothetical protein